MPEPIQDVTDTALWVASYRAKESKRPDAIFHDRLAERLAGEKGPAIAAKMIGGEYTEWSVVIRTHIIDSFIAELVAKGVDTVVNLGAGLDTRPYRLKLPPTIRWIEVDFPQMIEHKEKLLVGEQPLFRLERIKLDLSNVKLRQELFAKINSESTKVLVLTEGVVPYLTSEQVASLAQSLREQKNFRYWIVDYFSDRVMKYMKSRHLKQMKNAPFQFWPSDWFGFFSEHGWKSQEMRYLGEESRKLGRTPPAPWLAKLLFFLIPKKKREELGRMLAYVVLEPNFGPN